MGHTVSRGSSEAAERAGGDRGAALRALRAVLEAALKAVERQDNRFVWSGWDDGEDARNEIVALIDALHGDPPPDRRPYAVLFAPTGPLQELSLDSGWGATFLELADRFDRAAARVWGDTAAPNDASERAFGCARCWPDGAEAAWAVRADLARDAVLIDAQHVIATLLRCTACDQVFLSLFTERIDWIGGEDPQSWTVLPLVPAEAARLTADGPPSEATIGALGSGRRSLRREHPSDGSVHVFWGTGIEVGEHD